MSNPLDPSKPIHANIEVLFNLYFQNNYLMLNNPEAYPLEIVYINNVPYSKSSYIEALTEFSQMVNGSIINLTWRQSNSNLIEKT